MDYVTPDLAAKALLMRHPKSNPLRVRMALCGALRAEIIRWQPQRWLETFTHENGSTFNAAGGWTDQAPHWGWPADFWVPSIASDKNQWETNWFTASGTVTMENAPYKVALWLGRNGGGHARWERVADEVNLHLDDVLHHLGESGWSTYANVPAQDSHPRPMAGHYRSALIRLIAEASADPDQFKSDPQAAVRHAFDGLASVPDVADLYRLGKEIREAIEHRMEEDWAPPSD